MAKTDALAVRFWGTRGSFPTPGPKTVLFGGNTPCVEVRVAGHLFLIDAGSGFAGAGYSLLGEDHPRIDVLFSHLHHDHVSGFPFFKPSLMGRSTIRTHCGNLGGDSAAEALATMFAPPLFPVTLDALPGRIEHVGFKAGEPLDFGMTVVSTCPLFHPGGATGYRFDHAGRRVCYISDIEHADPWPASHLVRFCSGADLVIFDTMYTSNQYGGCRGWGHSTWQAGLSLCRAAGARAMAGFHHNPAHTDADLERIEGEIKAVSPDSFLAREGQVLTYAAVRELATA